MPSSEQTRPEALPEMYQLPTLNRSQLKLVALMLSYANLELLDPNDPGLAVGREALRELLSRVPFESVIRPILTIAEATQ